MKKILFSALLVFASFSGFMKTEQIESDKPTMLAYYGEISEKTGKPKTEKVSGYKKKNGTYVKPYYRSRSLT